MNEVINISISSTELLFIILGVVFLIGVVYLMAKSYMVAYMQDYKVRLLSEVYDDLEDYLKRRIVTSPTSTVGISAQRARQAKESSVNDEDLDELLKPVYDKIAKASENGDGEIFLNGQDWYCNTNEKYIKATKELQSLGYEVRKGDNGFGVWVKW